MFSPLTRDKPPLSGIQVRKFLPRCGRDGEPCQRNLASARWSGSGCDRRRGGTHSRLSKAPSVTCVAALAGEVCTEAGHEPVDSLVHEILVASSAGADCCLITGRTETRSRGGNQRGFSQEVQ